MTGLMDNWIVGWAQAVFQKSTHPFIQSWSFVHGVKSKKPTAFWQWVDKFRERIKTQLPRWSAARS
jgi:hypothetical protein